ncbi:MAG TPA: IS5 family transposase [Steroidobacteraceae bacterium]|nr:IS5 family transposase [Steroidobacteraceae bacterium]
MRGSDVDQGGLFSYVSMEQRVPSTHPLRRVRVLLDEALDSMSRDFDRVYAEGGRGSVAPERLVRALVLQVLYSIRSERLLCEQLDYNLLFRWFVGLSMDDAIWDHSTFTKNRDRLIEAGVARKLLRRIGRRARREGLLSSEHFSVDGTLVEAWSAVKSMRRRDGKDEPPPPGRNPHVDFHGQSRSNETHLAPHEPQAKLFRKGKGHLTKLYYMTHILMEHRQGLPVDVEFTEATGFAERATGIRLMKRNARHRQCTLAADKAYDTREFVAECRALGVTPHVAQNYARPGGSAIDARTTRHAGYLASQRIRKRIEEAFGWGKDGRPMRKMRVRGFRSAGFMAALTIGCHSLLRVAKLLPDTTPA